MHFRLLYVAVLVFVLACLQDAVALPTGTRFSSIQRRADAVKNAAKHVAHGARKAWKTTVFMPAITMQAFFSPKGEHSEGTGHAISDDNVIKVFGDAFPLAQRAYDTDVESVKAFMRSYGTHMVFIDHVSRDDSMKTGHPPMYIFADTKNKMLLVFFAGTGSKADALTDGDGLLKKAEGTFFTTFAKQQPPVRIHEGFMGAMVHYYAGKIVRALDEAIPKYHLSGVLLTGHSYGGALAQLGHVVVTDHLEVAHPSVWVVTRGFGSPRITNPQGANLLFEHYGDIQIFHNEDDIVGNQGSVKALGFQHIKGCEVRMVEGQAITFYGTDDKAGISANHPSTAGKVKAGVASHAGPYHVFVGYTPIWGPVPITNGFLGNKGIPKEGENPVRRR